MQQGYSTFPSFLHLVNFKWIFPVTVFEKSEHQIFTVVLIELHLQR